MTQIDSVYAHLLNSSKRFNEWFMNSNQDPLGEDMTKFIRQTLKTNNVEDTCAIVLEHFFH